MSVTYLLASIEPDSQIILAKSLSQFLTDLANSFTGVVKAAATAVIFFFILKELVNSFTLTKLMVAASVGAIATWLIWGNGVGAIANMLGNEVDSADKVTSQGMNRPVNTVPMSLGATYYLDAPHK